MKYIILICFFICNSILFAQSVEKCNACTFLDIDFKGTIPIFDRPGGKIIKVLGKDSVNENYYNFNILDKNDSLFYIQAEYAIDGEFIIKGWIRKDKNIGIYSRAYSQPLKLYSRPDETSKVSCVIKDYNPDMYIVVDCIGEWLKVETIIHGKKYVGWMSPDMQCCNVFTTCS